MPDPILFYGAIVAGIACAVTTYLAVREHRKEMRVRGISNEELWDTDMAETSNRSNDRTGVYRMGKSTPLSDVSAQDIVVVSGLPRVSRG